MRRWVTVCLAGFLTMAFVTTAFATTTAFASTTSVSEPWALVDGEFLASDGKTAISGAMEKGVSISKYQNRAGDINWKKLVSQDITFAMIRLGDSDEKDPYFEINMKEAKEHGIKTGVIYYTKALTKAKAEEEASEVLELIKEYPVSYPVALDVESQYMRSKGLNRQQIVDITNAFCKVIADAGYSPVVYGDYETLTRELDSTQIPYHIWYVRYGVGNTYKDRTLWQCTDSARVDGIKGFVCLEFSFVDYSKLFAGTGWRMINGIWYYYEEYGMVRNTTMEIDGKVYRFSKSGHIIA